MPPKTLVLAGAVTLLAGIFLLWSIPIWLRLLEAYPWNWNNGELTLFYAWFCMTVAGAGGLLILRAIFGSVFRRWESRRGPRIYPDLILRNVFPWHRHRAMPLITLMPNFGLAHGSVLLVLASFFMAIGVPNDRIGLPIDLKAHESVVWEKSPWQETVGVYLATGKKYFVNGQPVARDALRARLQQELGHRMVWTVYFEADSDTVYMDAVYAMDVIQGLGAKLVWITPKVREELSTPPKRAQTKVCATRQVHSMVMGRNWGDSIPTKR